MENIQEEVIVNDLEALSTKEQDDKKIKVFISFPGYNFPAKVMAAWTSTLHALFESRKYNMNVSFGESSFVSFARMKTLGLDVLRGIDQKAFNDADFDVWLTIDSDIVFTPDNVMDIIEATKEHSVVSGFYRMSDLKNHAAVVNWDVDYFKKHGHYEFLTQEAIDKWKRENPNNKFMKVAYAGMGFMAVTKEALDSLNYPYFNSELEELRGIDGKLLRVMISEDVAFCKNLTKAGHDVYLMPNMRLGHVKELII